MCHPHNEIHSHDSNSIGMSRNRKEQWEHLEVPEVKVGDLCPPLSVTVTGNFEGPFQLTRTTHSFATCTCFCRFIRMRVSEDYELCVTLVHSGQNIKPYEINIRIRVTAH